LELSIVVAAYFLTLSRAFVPTRHWLTSCLTIAIASLITTALAAETLVELQTSTVDRPKIALVLGGGGAKGAAHIGVLKVLDEL
jgi:NTE family protein